ncbi:MAG: arginine--tRNA ligase [Saprospiraceae bacterium]
MSNFLVQIKREIISCFQSDFSLSVSEVEITLSTCKKEFEGDYTLILFPWVKKLSKSPADLAEKIGQHLVESKTITKFNLISGFLNISLPEEFWFNQLLELSQDSIKNRITTTHPEKYLIEYCSPNTNKPLHLGHVRNILIGWSVYTVLKELGHEVFSTQVINDRGIAICKSMLAWTLFGNGTTPESSGIKGDHFVGDYYVLFENKFREEYKNWQSTEEGIRVFKESSQTTESQEDFFAKYKNNYFNNYSLLGKSATEMLIKWENGDPATNDLWKMMNSWVYSGFEESFIKLGVKFDSYYYESETYLLGKDIIEKGLQEGVFIREADNSIWIDLTDVGLDKKIVLRSNGTSVYITQDLGTINERHKHYNAEHYVYVVADEQDYHFKVLKESMIKLKMPYAQSIEHLNYGMVELPSGKMKSREGNVVDADELIDEVIHEATQSAGERGELSELTEVDKNKIIRKIGMSALKYFILKVQAKKRMVFNPSESVDMQGHTGPYIVNAYVRIQSILRRRNAENLSITPEKLTESEKGLINLCLEYPNMLKETGEQLDPANLANYLYQLAKDFHKYYNEFRIVNAETEAIINWRLNLSACIGQYLEHGMYCLGIEMPERM